tara:strand:- start:911 stop:1177 length:267 start_codon:yes stop_codon:yes gene_type:complete
MVLCAVCQSNEEEYLCEWCEEPLCDDCCAPHTSTNNLEETVCESCYSSYEDDRGEDMYIDSLTEEEYQRYRYKEKSLKVLKTIINKNI